MKGFLVALLLSALPLAAGELVVKVDGVRNARGFVRGMVFGNADGFPEDHTRAVALAETRARAGEVVLRFEDVKDAPAAIIILHDENDNKQLEKNRLGIPCEGVGASNWRGGGRPKFKDAVVRVGPGRVVRVRIKYF